MTLDKNKGITAIAYNHLNLPQQVNKGATDYIVYTYDATGRKLTQQVFGATPKTTQYLGEYVYENIAGTDVLQFVSHERGRIVPDNSSGAPRPFDYQYFLKDHLGNVRVTFSEKKTTTEYKATFEAANATNEALIFKNYSRLGVLNEFDHTDVPGTSFTFSQLLHGGSNKQVGAAKSFAVNPGDVIDMEVYAKFETPGSASNDLTTLLSALVSAFSLGTGTGLESPAAQTAFNGLFPLGGAYINSSRWDDTAPKAYLNYILFDQNFALQDFGYDQISSTAGQVVPVPPNVFTPHDYLNLHVRVKQKGYLYVYVSNENDKVANVYFDDLKITYNTGVEQAADYYPFGLRIASTSFDKAGSTKNSYLYNGKEEQDEMDLGWMDYGARMYMAELARFAVNDGYSEKYYSLSTYHYVANNPVNSIDKNGDFIVSLHYKITEDVLNKYGYSSSASRLAWYSSIYADNPSRLILLVNNLYALSNGLPPVRFGRTVGWGSTNKNSQDTGSPSESMRHAMTGDYEDPGNVSPHDAKRRGQEFGWKNIFKAAESGTPDQYERHSEADIAFGDGFHALQDSKAHEGVKMKDHDLDKDMAKGKDGQQAFNNAMSISESALVVIEMLNNNFSHVVDGTVLDISGMNKDQFQQIKDAAFKSNRNIRFIND